MRRCSKCGAEKAPSEFRRASKAASGFHSWCKACGTAADRARYRANGESIREANRKRFWANREAAVEANRARRYGLTVEQLRALLAPGCCEVCGGTKNLHVDHDHGTGEARGLLCGGCNAGIGQLGDDPERIAAAAEYLRRRRRKVAA